MFLDYKRAKAYIENLLDIKYYIKLISQINQIKQIVLQDKVLINSLDFMKKINLSQNITINIDNREKEEKIISELIEYFKGKIANKAINEADNIIFKDLDNSIKEKIVC